MFDGGIFKGVKFKADNDTDETLYQFAILWGKLVADPKVEMFKKKKTSFTVKFHNKNYCNVVMWDESEAATVAGSLEKGDMVLCLGTISTREYVIQKGEHRGERKQWTDLNAQVVIPMSLIQYLLPLYGSDAIRAILNKETDAIPEDVMESAGDFEGYLNEADSVFDEPDF